MLQFWRISTNAEPRCRAAAPSTSVRPFLSVSIARATNDASAPIAIESGLNGWSREPKWRRLRHLAELRRRRVLALRESVDPVVEEEDLQVHIAAQRVNEVVPTDREGVAVARDHPDREIGCATASRSAIAGVRRGSSASCRSARRRETRRAADCNEHDPLALETEPGMKP